MEYGERNIAVAIRNVNVTLDNAGGITTAPWVVDVDLTAANPNPDSIHWIGTGCRIKIEPDHPEHFNPRLPQKYRGSVTGKFDVNAPAATYKYCISVLETPAAGPDTAVYRVDPDYKVER